MDPGDKSDKFWAEDPMKLVSNYTFLPSVGMTYPTLLNAMTRLIIIVSLLLFMLSIGEWWIFLVLGIVIVCLMWYYGNVMEPKLEPEAVPFRTENYKCQVKEKILKKPKVIYLRKKIKGYNMIPRR